MGSVAHYLEVNVPAEKAYAWWRGLTNLPLIMPDVESVSPKGGDTEVTHWKVRGPLGRTVEWDARIVEDVPATRHRLGHDRHQPTQVRSAGAVRFDDHGGTTGVEVSLRYEPPAGKLGEVVATLFSNPDEQVRKALASFKRTIEAAGPGDADEVDGVTVR
ncbi:MAG TPA: SRPBCC family protein [Frankiaceae bacterium]|nr:SRPBCC family protein [Frankiaceae bacterium]